MSHRVGTIRILPGEFRARRGGAAVIITAPDCTVMGVIDANDPDQLKLRKKMRELVESGQVPSPGSITAGEYHGD